MSGCVMFAAARKIEHLPVMFDEALDALHIRPGGTYVDCTVGGGGHALGILGRLDGGRLVCIDRDVEAVRRFAAMVAGRDDVEVIHANFESLAGLWQRTDFSAPDGIFYDLGVSSFQLESSDGRGFSFLRDELLDMRYDRDEDAPLACDLVNGLSENELERLFFRFGERGAARRIARSIVRQRERQPVRTTGELAAIVASAAGRRRGGVHPATRVFLALRAVVNREMESLENSLRDAVRLARSGGRVVTLSYHSGEDRVVKDIFRRAEKGCECALPADECRCEGVSRGRAVSGSGLTPRAEEVFRNPRARSARMRIFERGE